MIRWLSRCIPSLSGIGLIILLIFAFGEAEQPVLSFSRQKSRSPVHSGPFLPKLKLSQKIFILYSLFIHLDTALLAIRLCISFIVVNKKMRATLLRRHDIPSGFYSEGILQPADLKELNTKSPQRSKSPPNSRSPQSDSGRSRLNEAITGEVTHAIILPNYQEDIDTLRMTLSVLASHPRARTQYVVYLAMEQKELSSPEKAALLMSTFDSHFQSIHATFHPTGLPGEIAGKSSNVAFAAREVFRRHHGESEKASTIITVIDSDTHLLQDYFSEIRRLHLTNLDCSRAFYVCPIVFDRNSHEIPSVVRVADMLWGAAGLAQYLPGAPIHIPTSVYSLPMTLAQEVGGWDGDTTAIGEDMHMLLKCYFSSGGRIITMPIFSPASQCNISTEYNQRWHKTLNAVRGRYQQALRHMWGSLDTGYAVRSAFKMKTFRLKHIPLFHLLWEAHFVPVHFVIILIGTGIYSALTPPASIPPALLQVLWITAVIRSISVFLMQAVFTVYEDYHKLCVNTRAQDMRRAGITDTTFSFRKRWIRASLLERASAPVVAILYGAAPALHAQICHLWTENLAYKVTPKPVAFMQPA